MSYPLTVSLDDVDELEAADPGEMLRATADAGAQIRRSVGLWDQSWISSAVADGRPRSVLVVGMGGSGISGDALAALCGTGCSVPISTLRGYTLPGWVGPLDLVIAVSCSGKTEETLGVAAQAIARGSRMIGVGSINSPLHSLIVSTPGASFVPVTAGALMPRAALWLMLTPLLLIADALGLAPFPASVLAQAADHLDEIAVECGPASPTDDNRAKLLAQSLAPSLPMVWGTGGVGTVAAYRMACQLNENAKLPVVSGGIPEVNHNQVVTFDGAFASQNTDIFHDPDVDGASPTALRLVVIRDPGEHSQDGRRADISAGIARTRGIGVDIIRGVEGHQVVRFASVIGVIDWVSVYTAIVAGVDPTPIGPIMELKDRIS